MSLNQEKSFQTFKSLVTTELIGSSAHKRKKWAQTIVNSNWEITAFSDILFLERRTALEFSWLLSDIGMINRTKLLNALPNLFELRHRVTSFPFEHSFATYWLIAGIPQKNKGEAVNLLFSWLQSNDINSTTKSRAMDVLHNLCKEHPEFKHELILHLENIKDNYSTTFQKRVSKILLDLDHTT